MTDYPFFGLKKYNFQKSIKQYSLDNFNLFSVVFIGFIRIQTVNSCEITIFSVFFHVFKMVQSFISCLGRLLVKMTNRTQYECKQIQFKIKGTSNKHRVEFRSRTSDVPHYIDPLIMLQLTEPSIYSNKCYNECLKVTKQL